MKKNFLIITLSLILIIGCNKEKNEIVGYVKVFEFDSLFYNYYRSISPENVTVKIEGTKIETKTDENGKFYFKNVPSGCLNISFSKDSIGTYFINSYQFVGGTQPAVFTNIRLFKRLYDYKIKINNAFFENDINNRDMYILRVFFETNKRLVRNEIYLFCIGNNKDVSYENCKASFYFYPDNYAYDQYSFGTSFHYPKAMTDTNNTYIVGYICINSWDLSCYYNSSNIFVNPSVGLPSNVFKFVK